MKRAIVLVLDSFGIGASSDADQFGDAESNTLGHIAQACAEGKADIGRKGPLKLPVLASLGILHAAKKSSGFFPAGMNTNVKLIGAYGYAKEISNSKDTPSGHWEMMGVPVLFDWGYFNKVEQSFPQKLLNELVSKAHLIGVIGNCHSSGTVILEQLGEEHMRSGKPIVYTSSASVFQIACHEKTFGLDRLYAICEIVRKILEPYKICRVIARPFIGDSPQNFQRTGNRRDYSVLPPAPTLLDKLVASGGEVVSIGKIADIFAHQGITKKIKATGIPTLFESTIQALESACDRSLIFTNFVDFDSSFGHRRDVAGYARALEELDALLPRILNAMKDEDVMVISADHGCDPTWSGTDHTREHVPVIVYGKTVPPISLGDRETFADIGQSLASFFNLEAMDYGTNFLD